MATTILPSKAQERFVIDNFSATNDTTKNYYGSGDIKKDNAITWRDASRLDSLIQGTFSDPTDDRLTDRAEINGDNQITAQDKQPLENYLNLNINLPAHHNKSNTAEKTDWFEKMIEIDKTDTINSIDCKQFANSLTINFHGYESLANGVGPNFPWKFSKNGRFNIPVYAVSTTTWVGNPHAINGVLVGDNPFYFNDWYFIEPFWERKIEPGDEYMATNKNVEINYYSYIDPEDGGGSPLVILGWSLDENGNPTLLETPYIKHIVKSNPNKDTIPPNMNLSIPDSSFYNSNVNLEYLVKENQTFLDSAYYELNGNRQYIDCEVPATSIVSAPVDSISGTISLSQEGEYDFTLYANDMAKPQGNESILNRYFVIDETSPTTSDNAPAGWQNSNFDVVLTPSDALSGVASTKYCISSTNDCTPNIEYSGPVPVSEEGEKYLRYSSKDKAGNNQPIVSKETKLDKTLPTIDIIYPEEKDYVGGVDSMVVSVYDLNLDNDGCWHSTDNGQTKEYFPCTSGEQTTVYPDDVEGANTWTVGAGDYATNTSGAEVNFNVIPDAVEEPKTLESYFKAYPNPTNGIVNFEFSLEAPENLRFSAYDLTGKQLEKRVINGNAGENKISYDFGKYSSNIIIYRIEGDKGYVKKGKVFKK